MHTRAGANGSVGFLEFGEQLFLEILDLQTSRVSQNKIVAPGCPLPGQKLTWWACPLLALSGHGRRVGVRLREKPRHRI
jgi:hypothetical protein